MKTYLSIFLHVPIHLPVNKHPIVSYTFYLASLQLSFSFFNENDNLFTKSSVFRKDDINASFLTMLIIKKIRLMYNVHICKSMLCSSFRHT